MNVVKKLVLCLQVLCIAGLVGASDENRIEQQLTTELQTAIPYAQLPPIASNEEQPLWKKVYSYLTGTSERIKNNPKHFTENLIASKITFHDCNCSARAKEILSPLIPYFINPEAMQRARCAPYRSYILMGNSFWITHIIDCLAGSIGKELECLGRNPDEIHVFSLSASDWIRLTPDEIAQDIKTLHRPCFLVIDLSIDFKDIELGLHKVDEVFTKLENFDPTEPIVVILATHNDASTKLEETGCTSLMSVQRDILRGSYC